MKIIKLNLKKHSYTIFIGTGIIKMLGGLIKKLNLGTDAYVITNNYLKKKYGALLSTSLENAGFGVKFKLVADTEKSKSIASLAGVIEDIARFDKKKKVFIIAFGGGVIGDLAGFVASVYKRGIPYVQVPTTLLAQVDSAIGGKTAVDLTHGKNLVGAFYQPKAVFSDLSLLKSLNLKQLRSGLAEVIKYGVIKDAQLFNFLEKNYSRILKCNLNDLLYVIWRSSLIKAGVVEKDEREEKGIRLILNFGHTLGHAIEAAGKYSGYNHGEAVALGMLLACDISAEFGLVGRDACQRVENLIQAVGLPTRIKGISLADVVKAHYSDKKFVGAKNRFVLLKDIGRIDIIENIPLKVIQAALRKRI